MGEHADTQAERVDGRSVRRSLNQTGRYVRQPKDDPDSNARMEDHGVGYSSTGLVAQMREQGNTWKEGNLTIKLAKAYGYCWGVERAVRMAYEARQAFPNRKIHVTNEIIHNPEVNRVSQRRSKPRPGCGSVRVLRGMGAQNPAQNPEPHTVLGVISSAQSLAALRTRAEHTCTAVYVCPGYANQHAPSHPSPQTPLAAAARTASVPSMGPPHPHTLTQQLQLCGLLLVPVGLWCSTTHLTAQAPA